MTAKQEKYLITFADNLKEGIAYYDTLFEELTDKFEGNEFWVHWRFSEIIINLYQTKNFIIRQQLQIVRIWTAMAPQSVSTLIAFHLERRAKWQRIAAQAVI